MPSSKNAVSQGATQIATQAVRQYYERNTNLFLTHGRQSRTRTIHRAVWAPGVVNLEAALNTTHAMICQEVEALLQPGEPDNPTRLKVADLGCGVGGSLFYLAERTRTPLWGLGLTISSLQARLARHHSRQLRLQDRCDFIEADFNHVPLRPGLDAIFSIEAFAHTPDAYAYLSEAARLLRAGGRLMLCDDFRLIHHTDKPADSDLFWLTAFQRGWHIPQLYTHEQVVDLARPLGLHLVSQNDLTPYLRLSRLPVLLVYLVVASWLSLRSYHPYWGSLLGGLALQQCLKQGLIAYRFLVLEKSC